MTRLAGWQSALEKFLNAHRLDPFAYGSWDCALFVCDAVLAMTGVDMAAQFRDRYSSRSEAREVAREITGGPSVLKIARHVTTMHAMPKTPVSHLRRGDVALIRRPNDFSLGIVSFNGMEIITVTPLGLQHIPLSNAAYGWRVG